MFHVCQAFLPVHCSLVFSFWQRAIGSLVCDVLLCFGTFPYGVLGQVWCLIVLISDICLSLTLNEIDAFLQTLLIRNQYLA